MLHGSNGRSGTSLRVRTWHHRTSIGFGLVYLLASLTGCHRSVAFRHSHHPNDAVVSVDSEQLFTVGLHYAAQGDLQRAEQYLIAARRQGYDEAIVVFWLVRVCISAGRYQSALNHATTYLRKRPNHWPLRLVIASIYEALGDVGRARLELEALLEAEPHEALPHYRLGMLYYRQHFPPELVSRHLKAYLRLAPSGFHGAEVTSTLGELSRMDRNLGARSVSKLDNTPGETSP